MRWFHIFQLSKYISRLEEEKEERNKTQTFVNKILRERIEQQDQEIALIRDKLQAFDKYFVRTVEKNEIENKDDDLVDVDENYRIPIVDGINVKQEGQMDVQANPLKIYIGDDYGTRPEQD